VIINSDINILGSLADWNLISIFGGIGSNEPVSADHHSFTAIKTSKSVKRFKNAIENNFLRFDTDEIESLFDSLLTIKGIDSDTQLFLFWVLSQNNELIKYLNSTVFFPAFYSGRVSIRIDDVIASLFELKETEPQLKSWSNSTLTITASKYLTLLKKFDLLEGTLKKTIKNKFLSDEMFLVFVFWVCQFKEPSNVLKSEWLKYGFMEVSTFIERVVLKKYTQFYTITYNGDILRIEPSIPYHQLIESIHESRA
jgi:hypothetical protein